MFPCSRENSVQQLETLPPLLETPACLCTTVTCVCRSPTIAVVTLFTLCNHSSSSTSLPGPGLCLGTRPPSYQNNPANITLCNLQQEVRMVCPVARPVHSSTPYYSVHCDLYWGWLGVGMEVGMAWN